MVFRKLESLSTQSSMSCAISRQSYFCSIVSSFGTNFVDTLLKPISAVKMVCTDLMLTPTSPASSWTVIWRSCMTKVHTWLMTSFRLVEALPWRGSLSTDVLPSLKRLYHSFIRVILMASSPKPCWIFRIVSTWVSPSFWQNLMQYRCSSCFPSFCNNWQSNERSQHLHSHWPTAGYWCFL